MVEESHAREGHGHAEFIATLDHDIVADRAAGLCHKGNAALTATLDIIVKREEGVGCAGNAVDRRKIRFLFLGGHVTNLPHGGFNKLKKGYGYMLGVYVDKIGD